MKSARIAGAVVVVAICVCAVLVKSVFVSSPVERAKLDFLLGWKAGPEFMGYFVAKAKGFYQQEGLGIIIHDGAGGADSVKLVAAGKFKLAEASAAETVIARTKGMPIVSLAAIFQRSPVVIYSLKEKAITKPADLKGKTLGVFFGSTAYHEYKAMMASQGVDQTKVKEVDMGWTLQPILTGQVDAAMGYTQNQPNQLRLQGKEVAEMRVEDWGVRIYGNNIIANQTFLETEHEVVAGFMTASIKGWEYALEHPDEAIDILLAGRRELDEKFVKLAWAGTMALLESEATKEQGIGAQRTERWAAMQELLWQQKVIDKKVDVAALFSRQFLPTKNR